MLDELLLIGWPAAPPKIDAPWWYTAVSLRPCICLSCLGLASSDIQGLAATSLLCSGDICEFGEVEQLRYCFCMQKAAASPKTTVASSAAPRYLKNSVMITLMNEHKKIIYRFTLEKWNSHFKI